MKKGRFLQKFCFAFAFTILLLGTNADQADGALNTSKFIVDLNELVIDGNTLVALMESLVLSPFSMSTQLISIEDSVGVYLNSVGDVYKTIVASIDTTSMAITDEILVPLEFLSGITVALSQSLAMLSETVASVSGLTTVPIITASLDSMLRLSDDIGGMADRIIEMADKILLMADNIGLMADRILETQTVQSYNLKLVIDACLEIQNNILPLFILLL
jgi:hypothetical protein